MRLHLVTGPAAEPVTLAEAKTHRRVVGADEDDLITDLITAARELFEQETGRQVITATWRLDLDGFPMFDVEPITIPKAPLLAVSSITYLDTNGDMQTWAASEYTVKAFAGTFAKCGMVYPGPDFDYPETFRVPNSVSVTFTAGYGATASTVPDSVKNTIKEIVGDLYEERESFVTGTIVTPNPSFHRMLNRFRIPAYA